MQSNRLLLTAIQFNTMSSTPSPFLFLRLSLLLCTSILVTANWSPPAEPPLHHHHRRTHPHPPAPSPFAHPPTSTPPPPKYPPAKKLAVQGVVYCKSCKYKGYPSLIRASPLPGAVVKLQCKFPRYSFVQFGQSNKSGYFLFLLQKVYAADSGKCRVLLVSSPLTKCRIATYLGGGRRGAPLVPARNSRVPKSWPYLLFNVGPLAFDSDKKCR